MKILEHGKRRGFLVVPGSQYSQRWSRDVSEFFSWCRQNNRPFVVVERRRKFAGVEMDLISTPSGTILSDYGEQLAKDTVLHFSEPLGTMLLGVDIYSANKVRLAHAERFAATLLAIFRRHRTTERMMKGE